MATMKGKFDTAERTSQLIPQTVIVEGKEYRVKRTGKALKEIMKMNPEAELMNLDPAEGVDRLYASISLLLVDGAGEHPDPEILEEEIDFEVANILMETFMPNPGNPPEAATPLPQESPPSETVS